jgi:hypothetical protein
LGPFGEVSLHDNSSSLDGFRAFIKALKARWPTIGHLYTSSYELSEWVNRVMAASACIRWIMSKYIYYLCLWTSNIWFWNL